MIENTYDPHAEWLETDGLGGFASGTVSGIRTRRYHALLLTATTPPTGRYVLVNGFEAWVETPSGRFPISSQRYVPNATFPDGHQRIESFTRDPWPTWVYRLQDGTRLEQSLFIPHGQTAVVLTWNLLTPRPKTSLFVRPLLSGRDYHALHHENPVLQMGSRQQTPVRWRPYSGLPAIEVQSNARYREDPQWYRQFLYQEEKNRGLDFTEDLASPGVFEWDLSAGDAQWVLSAGALQESADRLRSKEQKRRRAFSTPLDRAADDYIVRRGSGQTIVAGYPWFTDWGRDTFIALRGLGIASGRLDVVRNILLEWAGVVSQGMLPNLFPDRGSVPEYNSVDASLWYIIAVHDYLAAARMVPTKERRTLEAAIDQILQGYMAGTRFGIRMDTDGLLAAGVPGVQLTWMDAKIGDWVVTPRIGKPVEIQALWINALRIGGRRDDADRALKAFRQKFWNEAVGGLYDVIDADHVPGRNDASIRPNQIFAVGGLPYPLLDEDKSRRVVSLVESQLLTPLGLRSLSPMDPAFRPRYEGGVLERDSTYHQGTVWPWLMGAFVEAWLRIHSDQNEARRRFLEPMLKHLDDAGLGHVSEIADAEAPFTPRGCPFQAWSLGELIRIDLLLKSKHQEKKHEIAKIALPHS